MTPRTATKLGWLSFALAGLPIVLIVIAIAVYFQQPPPLSGFEGVGWFFAMLGSLMLLAMATYVVAPISIALGGLALVALRRTTVSNRSRIAAVAGIFISLISIASVATGHVLTMRRIAAMSPANRPTDFQLSKRRIVEQRVERLVAECRAYASDHNDRFPADMTALANWCARNGHPLDANRPQDFEYYGAGVIDLTRGNPTSDDFSHAGRLILFFEKVPIIAGARVIGVDGASAHTASATSVPETDLPQLKRASNEERARRALGPMKLPLSQMTSPADAY